MVATNEAELIAMLTSPLQGAVDTVMAEIYAQNQLKILATVYANGNDGYDRTYEFLDAWKISGGGGGGIASGTFEYDPGRLNAGGTPPFNYPYGAQHQSVLTGASSAESVADYVYLGHGGIWSGGGRNAFKKLESWLTEAKMVAIFGKGLRSNGLKVTQVGGASKSEL